AGRARGRRAGAGLQRALGDALPDDRHLRQRPLLQPPRRVGPERARSTEAALMPAYIVRRLLSGLLMLFAITLVTFAVFRLIPMPPGCLLVPCGPTTFPNDAQLRAAEHKLGADRPVPVQYAKFVWRIGRHGTFGASWTGGSIDTSL